MTRSVFRASAWRRRLLWLCGLRLALAARALEAAQTLPAYQPEAQVSGSLSSIGDGTMQPLMDGWFAGFRTRQRGVQKGGRWEHKSDGTAFGALLFELADMAPLARDPLPSELAPYAHQFMGDMMKSPLLVQVATIGAGPAYVAVNKRPGSPLPQKVKEFLSFALSEDGQRIVAGTAPFRPLTFEQAEQEKAKLQGFLPTLDPALLAYRPAATVSGTIRSVGSDGMKTLMDRWMRDFRRAQPGAARGERWEHLGTLNGFHALISGEADIAPMGRELWPSEREAYDSVRPGETPFEIRVARGGFNTPQRTTAQAVFVHEKNPLARISVPQLFAIFGGSPEITRWGQLGLGGEWADRPIRIYLPPRAAPNAMSMQIIVLKNQPWNAAAKEGSIAETARSIASDPAAIGFGGFEEGGPGLKALAVAARDGGPWFEGNAVNASTGRYPLTRYMYLRLNRKPREPLSSAVKEFLRYVLSREGQEPILYSGYFPLTAAEVEEELAKLE